MSKPHSPHPSQGPQEDHMAQFLAAIGDILRQEPPEDGDCPHFFVTPDAWLLLMASRQTLQFN